MNLEEEGLDSVKEKKALKFLGGFLGWFIINTLIYALLNLPDPKDRFLNSSTGAVFWILVLLVNIIVLTVLATLKRTRLIAFGVISALALNFFIATSFLTSSEALCFIPVTYPVYPSKPSINRTQPTLVKAQTAIPTNKRPIGFHDGNEGTVGWNNCTAFGWATDPDDRKIDLYVRVLSDGEEVVKVIANAYRSDLNVANGCPGGTCGYNINLRDWISANEQHFIQVQAQDAQSNEWISLNNSPKKLECTK